MKNAIALVASAVVVLGMSVGNAHADKVTTIKEKDGTTTTVRTDSKGTQVTNDGRALYTSGGDRHKEQVDHSLKSGGKVIPEKGEKKQK